MNASDQLREAVSVTKLLRASALLTFGALVVTVPALAQTFRFERDQRGNIEGKRASCEVYARLAAVQTDANVRYRCGNKGPQWTREGMPHFRWCRFVPRSRLAEEMRFRSQELQRCFDQLGDFDEAR